MIDFFAAPSRQFGKASVMVHLSAMVNAPGEGPWPALSPGTAP
jgi:hypothetical protein